jgi:hypothetical protein
MFPKNVKTRNFHWMLMSILVVSAMIFSATIRTASADATAQVFVDPPQLIINAATVGQSFKVNVTIANVTSLAGVEFLLNWNSSLLTCYDITENLFHTVTPQGEWENIWSIKLTKNNTAGTAQYAQTYQDLIRATDGGYAPINITTANYPEGKLTIAVLTFNITQVPATNTFIDGNLTLLPVKLGDNQPLSQPIPVNVTNGHYTIYGPPETLTSSVTYGGNTYNITTVTNASVVPDSMSFTKFNDTQYLLDFNVTGTDGSTGYVNVTIPKALMSINPDDQWKVKVNGTDVTPTWVDDATNWYVYFTTSLSTKPVEIIGTVPEFTLLVIPLLMAVTLIAVGIRRRRRL